MYRNNLDLEERGSPRKTAQQKRKSPATKPVVTYLLYAALIVFIVTIAAYPAAMGNTQEKVAETAAVEQQPVEQQVPVNKPVTVPQTASFNSQWAVVESIDKLSLEELEDRITIVPTLLGGVEFEKASSEIEAKRNEMLETYLSLSGENKIQQLNLQAWWLVTASSEGHELADEAIVDLIGGFDSSARQSLGNAGLDWVANSISAIAAFGEYIVPNNYDTPYSGMTAKQIADKLKEDQISAMREEKAYEAAMKAYEEEMARQQAKAEALLASENSNTITDYANFPSAPNPVVADENNTYTYRMEDPQSVEQPNTQPDQSNQQAPQQGSPDTSTDQQTLDNLPTVDPEFYRQSIAVAKVGAFGLSFSSSPTLWLLRSVWEALHNAVFTGPDNTQWYILQTNSFFTFEVLGFEMELVSIWLGETEDTLSEVEIPSLVALQNNIEEGFDANGHKWWVITTFVQYPHNVAEGETITANGIAQLIRGIVEKR